MKRRKWNTADKQAFADGSRTRAQTFRDRKKDDDKKSCRKWLWRKDADN